MKNRIELIKHFRDLGFKKGAEIGVFDGRFSEVICQIIPGVNLLAVDSWELGKYFPKYKVALDKLAPFNNVTVMRDTSMNIARGVTNFSLDFVFIDADHEYSAVQEDIATWAKKVRIGGVVAGHDYYITRTKNLGVINAVDEYVKKYNYKLELTDWDEENLIEDDRQPSWYFYKNH